MVSPSVSTTPTLRLASLVGAGVVKRRSVGLALAWPRPGATQSLRPARVPHQSHDSAPAHQEDYYCHGHDVDREISGPARTA